MADLTSQEGERVFLVALLVMLLSILVALFLPIWPRREFLRHQCMIGSEFVSQELLTTGRSIQAKAGDQYIARKDVVCPKHKQQAISDFEKLLKDADKDSKRAWRCGVVHESMDCASSYWNWADSGYKKAEALLAGIEDVGGDKIKLSHRLANSRLNGLRMADLGVKKETEIRHRYQIRSAKCLKLENADLRECYYFYTYTTHAARMGSRTFECESPAAITGSCSCPRGMRAPTTGESRVSIEDGERWVHHCEW